MPSNSREKRTAARVVIVDAQCEQPGCPGLLIVDPNAAAQMSIPPRFCHICSDCGVRVWLPGMYPKQEIIKVDP